MIEYGGVWDITKTIIAGILFLAFIGALTMVLGNSTIRFYERPPNVDKVIDGTNYTCMPTNTTAAYIWPPDFTWHSGGWLTYIITFIILFILILFLINILLGGWCHTPF